LCIPRGSLTYSSQMLWAVTACLFSLLISRLPRLWFIAFSSIIKEVTHRSNPCANTDAGAVSEDTALSRAHALDPKYGATDVMALPNCDQASHIYSCHLLTTKSLLMTHFSPLRTSLPSCSMHFSPCRCNSAIPTSKPTTTGCAWSSPLLLSG